MSRKIPEPSHTGCSSDSRSTLSFSCAGGGGGGGSGARDCGTRKGWASHSIAKALPCPRTGDIGRGHVRLGGHAPKYGFWPKPGPCDAGHQSSSARHTCARLEGREAAGQGGGRASASSLARPPSSVGSSGVAVGVPGLAWRESGSCQNSGHAWEHNHLFVIKPRLGKQHGFWMRSAHHCGRTPDCKPADSPR